VLSKTLWVNLLVLAAALLADPVIQGAFPRWKDYILPLLAAVNIVLRFVTSQPLGTAAGPKDGP
jgi:hypothetical protein